LNQNRDVETSTAQFEVCSAVVRLMRMRHARSVHGRVNMMKNHSSITGPEDSSLLVGSGAVIVHKTSLQCLGHFDRHLSLSLC